jgi:hypothetical protein
MTVCLCLSNVGELVGFVGPFLAISQLCLFFSNWVNNFSCYVTMKHTLKDRMTGDD